MKFFRLPRSRRLERVKWFLRSTLRATVRTLPLPASLKTTLQMWLPKLPGLKPRWARESVKKVE